jgi:parallel beta-helix repeat protein
MADPESGVKWWIRYAVVPLIGGGGLIALIIAFFAKKADEAPIKLPESNRPLITAPTSLPRPSFTSDSTGIKIENSRDVTLDHNTIDGVDTAIDVQNSSDIKAKENVINGGSPSLTLPTTPEPAISPPH